MCFLKLVDHTHEDGNDRLLKIRLLHDLMREKCQALPTWKMCERRRAYGKMQRPRTIYAVLGKKSVKWDFKVFAACDSDTLIIVNFNFTLDTTLEENMAGGTQSWCGW